MRFTQLNDWLTWQESLNPKEIDLGLDRVKQVLTKLKHATSFNCPLITVAGTNGKGSVVAALEAIAKAAGLKTCSYTSPHIFQYNERIKIDGTAVDDDMLCQAFESIDQVRGEIPLTYFEFGTLAAIDISFAVKPDLVILEVGLGGRLDATNIMDADVSVITSIAIDHIDWLGDNRELIGFEKAGIFRAGKPVVCGDADPPKSVVAEAENKQCEFLLVKRDFDVIDNDAVSPAGAELKNWALKSSYGDISSLPLPNLTGEFQKVNIATAILALQLLRSKGLLDCQLVDAVRSAPGQINLAGRFQKINDQPRVFVDVAHNPQASQALSSQLKQTALAGGKTWAIVAMLADKDVTGVLENLLMDIDHWCFAGLENITRGLPADVLFETLPDEFFGQTPVLMRQGNRQDLTLNQCTMLSETVLLSASVTKACDMVMSQANEDDRIIIFGSFYTVAEAMQYFSARP